MPNASSSLVFAVTFACVSASANQNNLQEIKTDSLEICGLHLTLNRELEAAVSPMVERRQMSRADNARYLACPYAVKISYKSLSMPIEFLHTPLLADIRHFDDASALSFRAGAFEYDASGWHSAALHKAGAAPDVIVRDSDPNIFLLAKRRREPASRAAPEYCVDIAAIGKLNSSAGSVCSEDNAAVDQLYELFRKTAVLSF